MELRTEKVYLGVALLRAEYPDVQKISERVLEMFYSLRVDLGVRELTNLVQQFRDIQFGEVVERNVPRKWLESYSSARDGKGLGGKLKSWIQDEGKGEGELVLVS